MIEYRYDGARARYLDRMLDEQQAKLGNVVEVLSTWTDYDGSNTYSDFTFSVAENKLIDGDRYELGIAHVKVIPGISSDTFYAYNDHLGTLRAESDEMAAFNTYPVHTAFGEDMTNLGQRHSYAGAFGYQSNTNFDALHVGTRYYDPSNGRFLQRDTIGTSGGLNVYAYVGSVPTRFIDPQGTYFGRRGPRVVIDTQRKSVWTPKPKSRPKPPKPTPLPFSWSAVWTATKNGIENGAAAGLMFGCPVGGYLGGTAAGLPTFGIAAPPGAAIGAAAGGGVGGTIGGFIGGVAGAVGSIIGQL